MKKIGSEWNRWDLHLHTASSFDYKYKGNDADKILVESLLNNNIKAVAITDHFTIDVGRIRNLRKLTDEIVFFPGVELRTDKGGSNIHIVLIFSNEISLDDLGQDFESIMIREKSKPGYENSAKVDPNEVYWDYGDILEFAKRRDAIITMHAGNKASGIDDVISNNTMYEKAIKCEYAENIHMYEVSRRKDIEGYKDIVFKNIERRPVIICSDNHDPRNYDPREKLWLKSDLTFKGLKQCLYHPDERVYIGDKPIILKNTEEMPRNYIKSIGIGRIDNPSNKNHDWFDSEIPINIGLTAIIGNKGSGKSALSDIMAITGNARTIGDASFLNEKRFNKEPENFSKDYWAKLTWLDDKEILHEDLSEFKEDIEYLQYLPQQYIEKLCNNLDLEFREEIDKVIFSYLEDTERLETNSIGELINKKSYGILEEIKRLRGELSKTNREILLLEEKLTDKYKKDLEAKVKKAEEDVRRHNKSKPSKVEKPKKDELKEIDKIKEKVVKYEEIVEKYKISLVDSKEELQELENIMLDLEYLKDDISSFNVKLRSFGDKDLKIRSNSSKIKERLKERKKNISEDIEDIRKKLDKENDGSPKNKLNKLLYRQEELIEQSNKQNREYYQYVEKLEKWETESEELLNGKNELKEKEKYIKEKLHLKYKEMIKERKEIFSKIYEQKMKKTEIYKDIYNKPEKEIEEIIRRINTGNMKETESFIFKPEISLIIDNFTERISDKINKNYSGQFSGIDQTNNYLNKLITKTNFDNKESLGQFLDDLYKSIYEDIDRAHKVMKDPKEFLDYIFGLEYLDSIYNLKLGGRELSELSPGERGIVLLIFYLALSKDNIPIIIDQPEDNLDNQSVYSNLVDCIKYAKTKRQVIIVTHNPNIAIACDAEQIIHCQLDKEEERFFYSSGSIENPKIISKVIDILEGTEPAFNLRKLKYNL